MGEGEVGFHAEEIREHTRVPEAFDDLGGYIPFGDESYMNPAQLEYFRRKLLSWREELVKELGEGLQRLKEESTREVDLIDQGSLEANTSLKLYTRDRHRRFIGKIDEALERIEAGTYGYCEETGEEIGLKRLEARPTATLSLEAQKRYERAQRHERRR